MSKLKYLQTNGKLKDSSTFTYAFNLPAVETCPGAGVCKEYCFALSEQKRYTGVMAYRQRSLELSKSAQFVDTINAELDVLRKFHDRAGTKFAIRIHASGDFYSVGYIEKWADICNSNMDIQFYCYTKSIAHWRRYRHKQEIPRNLTVIFSLGSTMDAHINREEDRHARIFQTKADAIAAGYELANEDDTIAWQSDNNKIGLVIFGATNKFKRLDAVRALK